MQLALQDLVLGRRCWEKLAAFRVQLLSSSKDIHRSNWGWKNMFGGSSSSRLYPTINITKQSSDRSTVASECSQDDPNQVEHAPLLRPKQEMAKIMLHVTGSLHNHRQLFRPPQESAQNSTHPISQCESPKSIARASRSDPTGGHESMSGTARMNSTARTSSHPTSPMLSPRPKSQAEAQLYDHFFTPKHLLPSVQAQYQQELLDHQERNSRHHMTASPTHEHARVSVTPRNRQNHSTLPHATDAAHSPRPPSSNLLPTNARSNDQCHSPVPSHSPRPTSQSDNHNAPDHHIHARNSHQHHHHHSHNGSQPVSSTDRALTPRRHDGNRHHEHYYHNSRPHTSHHWSAAISSYITWRLVSTYFLSSSWLFHFLYFR
jgi:hypothetical protein